MKNSSNQNLSDVLNTLRDLQEEIQHRFRAQVIGVFGSYTHSEPNSKSDLDVLVRFLDGATLFDLVRLADFLENQLKTKIDILSERAIRPELRERILTELVKI